MKRREKLEIVNDILLAIQNKGGTIKPTHLLYKSNLSHKKMMEYLSELMERGIVSEVTEKGKKMYAINQEGFNFIAQYKKIKEFSDSFGL